MTEQERIKLTRTILDALKSERERTGINFAKLLRRADHVPEGLSSQKIFNWLKGVKSAQRDHLEFVMETYAAHPTLPVAESVEFGQDLRSERQRRLERRVKVEHPLSPYRPITKAQLSAIKSELARTGIRYTTLITMIPPKFSSLSSQMIINWLSGRIKTARPEYIRCVIDTLRKIPDPHPMPRKEAQNVSQQTVQLASNKLGSKKSQSSLKSDAVKSRQKGLDASIDARVKQRPAPAQPKKPATVIEPEPIVKDRKLVLADPNIVMPRKSDLQGRKVFPNLSDERLPHKPDWKPFPAASAQVLGYPDMYRVIDEDTFDRLHAEVRRTRVSPALLVKSFKSTPPSLPARRIGEWMRLVTRSGEIKLINWVLKAYALLPDAK